MVKLRLGLLFFVTLFLAIGCSDDASDFGSGTIPTGDYMQVGVKSIKPTFFSQYHPDSIQTDDLSSLMLGGLWHEQFGMFRADIATQIRFDSIEFTNDGTWEVDSVTLIILQNDIYGDSAALNELKVFELNTDIDNYTSYYSNANESEYYDESDILGTLRYEPREIEDATKVYYSSGDSAWQYRIVVPIAKEYGQRLYDGFATYGNDVELFQEMFKGLYIKSTFGNKTLSLVNISTDDDEDYYTAVALHLNHKVSLDSIVEYTQYFYVNDECGRFSIFHHDFKEVDVETNENSTVSPDIVKLRGGGALSMRMEFPNLNDSLDTWFDNDTNFIINKAEMTIKLAADAYDYRRFVPVSTLETKIDTVGGFVDWYDNISSESYFGGTYDSNDKEYTFNITYFIQSLINNSDYNKRSMVFYNAENAFSPWMTMFYGKDSVDIDIYYTRY